MFDFLKRKKETDTTAGDRTAPEATRQSWFARLKQGLTKTRNNLSQGLGNLFLGKKKLDADLLDEIEAALLTADVGVETTQQLINTLTQKLARNELTDADAAFTCLKDEMKKILLPCEA